MHGWKFNPQINTQGDKDKEREREFAFWLDHGSAFFCVVCVLFICFDCGWVKERERERYKVRVFILTSETGS